MLGCCYSEVDAATAAYKTHQVSSKLKMIFDQYKSAAGDSSNSNVATSIQPTPSLSVSVPTGSIFGNKGMFDELFKHNQRLINKAGKSELDIYLEEPIWDIRVNQDLDVLKWWKDNDARFPDLSLMARDLLSIPITTVASESAFSIGARVLSKYKSSLANKCPSFIYTHNRLHGFNENDEEDGDL